MLRRRSRYDRAATEQCLIDQRRPFKIRQTDRNALRYTEVTVSRKEPWILTGRRAHPVRALAPCFLAVYWNFADRAQGRGGRCPLEVKAVPQRTALALTGEATCGHSSLTSAFANLEALVQKKSFGC